MDMRQFEDAANNEVEGEPFSHLSRVEVDFVECLNKEINFHRCQNGKSFTRQDSVERRDLSVANWLLAAFSAINSHEILDFRVALWPVLLAEKNQRIRDPRATATYPFEQSQVPLPSAIWLANQSCFPF